MKGRVLLLGLLVFLPACGHRANPLPPRRKTPPAPADFRLAQRGDRIEFSATAPAASLDGVPYQTLGLEFLHTSRGVDLEKAGSRLSTRAAAGQRVRAELPLPAVGTLLRAAARCVVGHDKGARTLTKALVVQPPIEAPRELTATLTAEGVALAWQGTVPPAVAPPVLGPKLPGTPRPAGTSGPAPRAGAAPAPTGSAPAPPAAEPSTATKPPATSPPTTVGATPPGAPAPAAAAPAARQNGFFVYRRAKSGAYDAPLGEEPLEQPQLLDKTAPLAVTLCYVVRAAASSEPLIESAASNEACLERRDISPPAAPTGLAVLPRAGGLELLWSPSPEPDLAGYRVYRASGGAAAERLAELPATQASYLDATAKPGTSYQYTISGFDQAGNESPKSAPAEAILP